MTARLLLMACALISASTAVHLATRPALRGGDALHSGTVPVGARFARRNARALQQAPWPGLAKLLMAIPHQLAHALKKTPAAPDLSTDHKLTSDTRWAAVLSKAVYGFQPHSVRSGRVAPETLASETTEVTKDIARGIRIVGFPGGFVGINPTSLKRMSFPRRKGIPGTTIGLTVVSEDRKTLFIVFRGTASKQDMVTDIMAAKTYGRMGIHAGFAGAVSNKLLKTVLKTVEEFEKVEGVRDKTVVFSGHSLGGAIAHVACAYVAAIKVSPSESDFKDDYDLPESFGEGVKLELITFGSPKVSALTGGGSWMQKALATVRLANTTSLTKTFNAANVVQVRVRNGDDPVPDLPPPTSTMWIHTARAVNLVTKTGNAGAVIAKALSRLDPTSVLNLFSVLHHKMDSYLSSLKEHLDTERER